MERLSMSLRTVGWCMIAGALVGGVAAIVVLLIVKTAVYRVGVGMVTGLIVGLAIEEARKKAPQ